MEHPHRQHLVQFYGADERRLVCNAAAFLEDSLHAGGAAIVVAAESRRDAILTELRHGARADDRMLDNRIVALDAAETLASFMRDGRPHGGLFASCVAERIDSLRARFGRVRGYGEMVGLLWAQRSFDAAIALERLWNEVQKNCDLDLFCGYPIDVTSDEFQLASMGAVLACHTQLVSGLDEAFEAAMERAMDEVLGDRSYRLRAIAAGDFQTRSAALPTMEKTILRLRQSLPRYADDVLARARAYHQSMR